MGDTFTDPNQGPVAPRRTSHTSCWWTTSHVSGTTTRGHGGRRSGRRTWHSTSDRRSGNDDGLRGPQDQGRGSDRDGNTICSSWDPTGVFLGHSHFLSKGDSPDRRTPGESSRRTDQLTPSAHPSVGDLSPGVVSRIGSSGGFSSSRVPSETVQRAVDVDSLTEIPGPPSLKRDSSLVVLCPSVGVDFFPSRGAKGGPPGPFRTTDPGVPEVPPSLRGDASRLSARTTSTEPVSSSTAVLWTRGRGSGRQTCVSTGTYFRSSSVTGSGPFGFWTTFHSSPLPLPTEVSCPGVFRVTTTTIVVMGYCLSYREEP